MRLHPALEESRVRKSYWPVGQFYLVRHVGRTMIVVNDETGKEIIFNRDDSDSDWVLIVNEERDLTEGAGHVEAV